MPCGIPALSCTHDRTNKVTFAVHRGVCRGLFERERFLFAFLVSLAVLERAGELQPNERRFLLTGLSSSLLDTEGSGPSKLSLGTFHGHRVAAYGHRIRRE